MHTLLAAFFAMLFSVSHTSAKPVTQPADASQPYTYAVAINDHASARLASPRLHAHSSYAEVACVSCRRTNVSYRVR